MRAILPVVPTLVTTSPLRIPEPLPCDYGIAPPCLTSSYCICSSVHRISPGLASSDFPNFGRNHNTGADFWSDSELRVARQTVFHDRERPSRLLLSVV